jgi:mycothiol synthase
VNVRRPTHDDAEAVAALINAYDEAHGVDAGESAEDVRDYWRRLDLERDAWLFEVDGRLAGAASAASRGGDLVQGDGYVHPDLRGRGVGSAILRLTEERAREHGAARIHNGTLHADTAGRALLEASGYAHVRSFLRMEISLADEPPAPQLPEGLRLVAMTEADDEQVYEATEEAFADHWEHHARPFDEWRSRRAGHDRSLWLGVRDGDELAAVSLNVEERFGAGWIDVVATRRAWRGRGLAQALLLASFAELRRRGQTRAQLGVDATNPTGAVRVYERVGMHVAWRADVYEKHL